MGITDILKGLKDKILDAVTFELLERNFKLLEDNNSQLKDKVAFQKDEIERLRTDNLRLSEQVGGLAAELDLLKVETTFLIQDGIAFKKDISGRIQPEPYCPKCHEILSTVDHSIYICGSCPYTILTNRKLAEIVKDL